MAKPAIIPLWTDGNAAKVQQPSGAKTLLGFTPLEKPSPFNWNWLQYFNGLWIEYFDQQIDSLILQQGIYDAVVGVGGTHATINDLIADMGVGLPAQDINVWVSDPYTVTATQIVSADGVKLNFAPRAAYSKGDQTLGIQVTGERCEIIGGRFLNFSLGADKAIQLSAASKYCIVDKCRFLNNDTEIENLGTGNALVTNIVEA